MTLSVNYDIAERLKSLSQPVLYFTMNPNESGGVVPEDAEGGNPYSYYNVPYTIVSEDSVVSTDANAYDYENLVAPLAKPIPCSVWDAKFPPVVANGDISLCEQFTELFNDDCSNCFTDGINLIQETDYCTSPVAPTPQLNIPVDFGSQPLASPVRFSNGVWR